MALLAINHIEIVDGKTVIASTRITVEDIVALYVMNQSSIEWITEQYDLTPGQIYAALSYYYDHKEAIDRSMDETEALASKIGIDAQDHLAQIRSRQSNS